MLSTFTGLAFGVCKNISFGLVCTTAERFTRVLKQQDNIGFCSGEVWRNLDEDLFTAFTRKRKPKKLKPFKPYAHQRRAIRNSYKHYVGEGAQRGKMIMPCGTGKSLAAFWIAEKLEAKRILVAVPSLALIRQTLRVWLRESYAKGWDVDWITVCSDESVGKISRDDLAVLKQDLGVPAVTDPKIIAKWLRKRHNGKVVVFTTYHSGKAIAQASKLARRNFDLGIMDEAHKTVGSKDKTFSHLLFEKNIKIAKRVFMTATERRYAGNKDKVISMDDLNVYGSTFEFLSFKDALEAVPPILSDYKILTKIISKEEVADLVRKRAFVKPTKGKWDEDIEADMLAALIILRKAIRRFKIRHAITFHSSIAKAKAFTDNQPIFSDLFPQYWKTDNFHVSGKMPTSVRARHMEEFKASKRAIMTNARCLTEGVDVPDIDCVLFADPKKSTIDIVQAVGRALRLSEGKKLGYVIVPVIIEDEGNFDKSDAFQTILMTLRALASNDERIIDYFRAKSQKKRTYNNIQIEVDERIAEKINVKDFTRELELQVWNKLAKLSWMPYENAQTFVKKLQFKNNSDWREYVAGKLNNLPKKPEDLPQNPDHVYNNKGWEGWGLFLGTGRIASKNIKYRNFKDARKYIRALGLKNINEWEKYCKGELKGFSKKPYDIPVGVYRYYKDQGFKNMRDWLGSGRKIGGWRNFKDARAFARKLKLKNQNEWKLYIKGELRNISKMPDDIPKAPHLVYKNKGWKGDGDWLGTGVIARSKIVYRDFKDARAFARKLGLSSENEWRKYKKGLIPNKPLLPDDIPSNPGQVYKDKGWISFGDWLGTGRVADQLKEFRSFKDARAFARKLKLKSQNEWQKYAKGDMENKGVKPTDIPNDVRAVYKDKGWIGFGDWLGTGRVASRLKEFRSFKDAREFARKLGLSGENEWRKYKKGLIPNKPLLPDDIPRSPERVFKNKGWKGWLNFFGNEPKQKKKTSK